MTMRKTNSRQRAANWVAKYCLRKAKEKVHESLFENEIVPLDENGKRAEWVKLLTHFGRQRDNTKKLRPTFHNVVSILENQKPRAFESEIFSNEDFFWCCDALG